jgi:DNA-directed RNA polymerase I subunit RPA2
MLQKLYSLVSGQISEDNPDSMQFQECLLPGYLYGAIIKEKLMDLVYTVKMTLQNAIKRSPNTVDLQDRVFLKKQIARGGFQNTGDKLAYFLSTGNLVSNTGLDLQQVF